MRTSIQISATLCFFVAIEPADVESTIQSSLQGTAITRPVFAGMRPLDLGSLRPGGATYIMQMTESGDLVQRRGRWASFRIMSIYIQEVAAVSFLAKLPAEKRQHVLSVAACFPWTLQMAWQFVEASIPHKAWFFLFSSHQKEAWNRRDGRETFQSV